MTFQLSPTETPPNQSKQPGRLWLRLLLLAGFVLSLLIGVIALLGLYLLPDVEVEQTELLTDPFRLVQPARIPAHLGLLPLAGADGDGLARQAATAGERALAYSILVYDGVLDPSRRAGELLRVGRLFLDANDRQRAQAAFVHARTVALFALPMPPLERADLLARSAEGLLACNAPQEALMSAMQAQHVAAQAAGLLPAQRLQILRNVEPILLAHGSAEEIARFQELVRSPGQVPGRFALDGRLPSLRAAYPAPALEPALTARREAARLLIDRVLLTNGLDIEPERAALAQALLAEDQVRRTLYAGWNDPALGLNQRHQLLLDYRNWLLLRRQAAEGGFGVRLVGEWEEDTEAIEAALNQVMNELRALLAAQVDGEQDELTRAMLGLESVRWLIVQAELGFYPSAPLGELSDRMEQAQAELERLQFPPDLPLYFDAGATPPGFRIAPRYR